MVTRRIARSAPHTTAVLAKLAAAALLVDNSQKPDGGGWAGEPGNSAFRPYAILWPNPGNPDGSVSEPYEYLDYAWQLTCVGCTAGQVEVFADEVRLALVGERLTIPGRSTYRIQQDLIRPVERDDAATPFLFYVVAQFSLRTQAS